MDSRKQLVGIITTISLEIFDFLFAPEQYKTKEKNAELILNLFMFQHLSYYNFIKNPVFCPICLLITVDYI